MPVRRLVSLVIPAFNEKESLETLFRRIRQIAEERLPADTDVELVVADDHSADQTSEIARRLVSGQIPGRLVRLSRNSGSHAACAAGLSHCVGDAAVVMAADLQDPPEVIPELVAKWREGYDVVWAVRKKREGERRLTLLLARAYYWIMRKIALPDMPPTGADFFLIDRKVIDAYNRIPEKHTSLPAMIRWMGFRQTSIEYVKQARHAGRSKWTLAKKVKLFVDSLVSFSYAPIRLMSLLGLLMALAGFLYAGVVVASRLVGYVVAGTGFAALMTVLLVGQGMILLMLGVLGEYLWRTYDEARGRPRYLIEEIYPPPGPSPSSQAVEPGPLTSYTSDQSSSGSSGEGMSLLQCNPSETKEKP